MGPDHELPTPGCPPTGQTLSAGVLPPPSLAPFLPTFSLPHIAAHLLLPEASSALDLQDTVRAQNPSPPTSRLHLVHPTPFSDLHRDSKGFVVRQGVVDSTATY